MVEPTDSELADLLEKLRGGMNESQSREMDAALVELKRKRSDGSLDTRESLKAAVMCALLLRDKPVMH